MLGTSKSIWGFEPRSIPNCQIWLDASDRTTLNSTTAVTAWNDKSGNSNNMVGNGTLSGSNMTFNGANQAFSNATYVFPFGAYSMFAVYSNTTSPTSTAYMNAVYGGGGFPMLGVYDGGKAVSARSVVANTGALTVPGVGWAAQIAGATTSSEQGTGIATDSLGNVFVTGYYGAALTLYNTTGTVGGTLAFAGTNDCFVAKYTPAGMLSWATRIAGTGDDEGFGITTDSSGNVLVIGFYGAALTLYSTDGTTKTLVNGGGSDAFIAKYTSAGVISWAARIVSTVADQGFGIATDSSGNVFVTGNYGAAAVLYGVNDATSKNLLFSGTNDCFIAKYTPAGAISWATRIASTGLDYGQGIAIDPFGSVLVTGFYGAAVTLYNQDTGTGSSLAFSGGYDTFVAKYTNDGAVTWAARIIGTGNDQGYGVADDSAGNVFVAGYYNSALTLYGVNDATSKTLAVSGYDVFIAKYTSTGAISWATRITGTGTDLAYGIATDPSGNVFVTGFYSAAVTLYNQDTSVGGSLAFAGVNDAFIAKYTTDGVLSWATRIAGAGNDGGLAIATDSEGNVLVTGFYGAALTLYNTGGSTGATLPYTGGTDVFIAKYSSGGFINGVSASSNVLVSATYTPSTFSPFVNGIAATTLAGTTLTATGLFLGGPSNYFNGSISEVLVYGSTLTAAQRQSVEGYLNKKWSVSLSNVHPFYTQLSMNRTFAPTDIPGASLWLDAADRTTMNSATTVTVWNDKSGQNNTMTGTATLSGSNMTFNGSTQAFSNTTYVFPSSNYSMFAVYSNTTAPASTAYMNAVYGNGGFPMIGVYGTSKYVSARSVVANTGALVGVALGWVTRIVGGVTNSSEVGNAITTDTFGNIFATGYYGSALTLYNTGGAIGGTIPFTGNFDCYIVKYTSSGTVSWGAQISGTASSDDRGQAIATDASGNVFVTGYYSAALTLYNTGGASGATLPFTGATDCFIAKYLPSGTVSWAAQIAGVSGSSDVGNVITTDTIGNVFVTGSYGATLTLYDTGGGSSVTLPYTGGTDCFIVKYLPSGTVSWAAQIAGTTTSSDSGNGIATDTTGNIFVAGYYTAALTLYNTGGGTGASLAFTGTQCVFLAKYLTNGNVSWAARMTTAASGVYGGIIATDTGGNIFIAGGYGAALTLYNSNGLSGATLSYGTSVDCFIAKYLASGSVSWATRISGAGITGASGVSTDASGNVFVCGSYGASVTVYNADGTAGPTLALVGAADCYLVKYSSTGVLAWATRITGAGYDAPGRISTDISGNVVVTGYYNGLLTFYNSDGTTGAQLPLPGVGGSDSFVAQYSPDGYIVGPVVASSNVLVSATYTPTTFSPFVNGNAAVTLAGTTLAATGLFVGGPSNYFNGSISELLVYSATLTTGQRQQVEGYLASKWNLRSQVVAGHQYKAIPPATPQPPLLSDVAQGNWNYDWQPYLKSLVTSNSTATAGLSFTGVTASNTVSSGSGVLAPNGNIYFSVGQLGSVLTYYNPNDNSLATITLPQTIDSPAAGLGADGNVYIFPVNANTGQNIIKITTTTNVASTIAASTNGWLGMVLAPNGNLYGIPQSVTTNVLVLNTTTGTTSTITGSTNGYRGGVLAPNGRIYCIPGTSVAIIDPDRGTITANAVTGTGQTNGYFGGVLGWDGNIYCIPTGTTVGVINPTTNVFTTFASTSVVYSGGCLGPDGKIYCIPRGGGAIGVINIATQSFAASAMALPAVADAYNGATLTPSGAIYVAPYNGGAASHTIYKITFTGLAQTPTLAYCLSAWTNKF